METLQKAFQSGRGSSILQESRRTQTVASFRNYANKRGLIQTCSLKSDAPAPTLGHRVAPSQQNARHRLVRANVSAPTAPPQPPSAPIEEKVPIDGEQAVPLTKTVTLLRGICNRRLKFHIEYGLKRGTTENCYVIRDGKDSILIDVPEQSFADVFVDVLNGAVPLRDIRHIVITHLTPLRLKSLREVLKRRQKGLFLSAGPLDIHLSNPAMQFLRSSLGGDDEGAKLLEGVSLQVARSGSNLSVGREGQLKLLPAPTPRWPDLLIAYYPQDRLLFSSKLFAAHVSPDIVGNPRTNPGDVGGFDVYSKDWKYYFDCMLAPVARQAQVTLDKLDLKAGPALSGSGSLLTAVVAALRAAQDTLEGAQKQTFGANLGLASLGESTILASALCPIHGPIVQSSITELLRKYREWTAAQVAATEVANVAVLYASAYGNTAALAQALSRGITKAGVGVETLNLELVQLEDVGKAISSSAGFVIGSPTLGGHMPTQVSTALGTLLRDPAAKGQPCGVFGSFGWSGEAVDEMESRLKDAGFQFAFDPIKVKFKPTAKDMQVAEESGTDLAQLIRKNLKKQEKQVALQKPKAGATGTEQAVGRLLGTLCVLTVRDGDATSAMLASWISQASFDPPGISVAVKQDRAVESFLGRGTKFVVNVLSEGKEKPIIKAMLKPFKPGEDRFEGLEVKESEESACAILPDIASYMECEVVDRMDTGDHVVVYAKVNDGKVVDPSALSAVHYRKAGTSY